MPFRYRKEVMKVAKKKVIEKLTADAGPGDLVAKVNELVDAANAGKPKAKPAAKK